MPDSTYHQIHFAWAEPTLLGRVGPGPAASSYTEAERLTLRAWRNRLQPALTVDYRVCLPDPADHPETLWVRAYDDGQAALVYRWPGDVGTAHAWAIVGPAEGLTLPRVLSLHENPNTRPHRTRPPKPGWEAMPELGTPEPWERSAAPGAVRARDRRAADLAGPGGEELLALGVAAALERPDLPVRVFLDPGRADLWNAVQLRFLWGLHRSLYEVLSPRGTTPAPGWGWSLSTYDPVLEESGQHIVFGPPTPGAGPLLRMPGAEFRVVAERLVGVLREEGGDALADHLAERGVPDAPTFGERRDLLADWLDPRPSAPRAGRAAAAVGAADGVGAAGDTADAPEPAADSAQATPSEPPRDAPARPVSAARLRRFITEATPGPTSPTAPDAPTGHPHRTDPDAPTADPTHPADHTRLTDTATPDDSTADRNPGDLTHSADPASPADHTRRTDTVAPADSVGDRTPGDPIRPSGPMGSGPSVSHTTGDSSDAVGIAGPTTEEPADTGDDLPQAESLPRDLTGPARRDTEGAEEAEDDLPVAEALPVDFSDPTGHPRPSDTEAPSGPARPTDAAAPADPTDVRRSADSRGGDGSASRSDGGGAEPVGRGDDLPRAEPFPTDPGGFGRRDDEGEESEDDLPVAEPLPASSEAPVGDPAEDDLPEVESLPGDTGGGSAPPSSPFPDASRARDLPVRAWAARAAAAEAASSLPEVEPPGTDETGPQAPPEPAVPSGRAAVEPPETEPEEPLWPGAPAPGDGEDPDEALWPSPAADEPDDRQRPRIFDAPEPRRPRIAPAADPEPPREEEPPARRSPSPIRTGLFRKRTTRRDTPAGGTPRAAEPDPPRSDGRVRALAEGAFGGRPTRSTPQPPDPEEFEPAAERVPEEAPPLFSDPDPDPEPTAAPDYAAETAPETSEHVDPEDNWPTQYADLPLARLERWLTKYGPEEARVDLVDARAAVRAERSELQRVRDERDHYHAELQDSRRAVARLDRSWIDREDDEELRATGSRRRRWPARVLVVVLLLAFLATGLEAGARFGVGALDLLGSLTDVPWWPR